MQRQQLARHAHREVRDLSRTVYVLGAGFTRAVLPSAPLLTDDYGLPELSESFAGFPRALEILSNERRLSGNRINIERLLTRLDEGMPFDALRGGEHELRLLRARLLDNFVERIATAREGTIHQVELDRFATHCVKSGNHCVTFNHDDVLDEALWKVNPAQQVAPDQAYWHPDGGYGYYCTSSAACIRSIDASMDVSSMLLLKLHGSANWRVRRGNARPLPVDAIVHFEPWLPLEDQEPFLPPDWNPPASDDDSYSLPGPAITRAIEDHLEPEPFIVPPVLTKSALAQEPILRLVWSAAFDALRKAGKVVFVGYSLPFSDLAARFLLSEALDDLDPHYLTIVNSTADRDDLMRSYRAVFPEVQDDAFVFIDGREWIGGLSEESAPRPSLPTSPRASARALRRRQVPSSKSK